MKLSANQSGVDVVAQDAIALVTELRDTLVINRQEPEDIAPDQMINARLDEAYLTGWLTNLVARALLHKALRSGEIGKTEFTATSKDFLSTRSVDGVMGGDIFPDLPASLHRIFERSAGIFRELGDMDSALGLNNASAY